VKLIRFTPTASVNVAVAVPLDSPIAVEVALRNPAVDEPFIHEPASGIVRH
jgi:hypothetical protein